MPKESTPRSGSRKKSKPVRAKPSGASRAVSGFPQIRAILVPVDFSNASRKALRYAVQFAQAAGARLMLLHVVEPLGATALSYVPLAVESDKMSRGARERLDELARKEVPAEHLDRAIVRSGRGYNEIAQAARTLKADLIIMATHGYTGIKHVLLGSTTERVVRHAPCAVLIVRAS